MMRKTLFALPLLMAGMAQAAEAPPAMADFIDANLKTWVNDPQVVAAIQKQNRQTHALSEAEILARDEAWRAEVGQSNKPMIDMVLSAPLSAFLKDHVDASQGRITEVFVMDSQGLNVASSAVTSDYWQGDEAKFQKSFGAGPGAIFVDDVELDESTQTYQGQVSFAITDQNGDVVGAITVGLDASAFF